MGQLPRERALKSKTEHKDTAHLALEGLCPDRSSISEHKLLLLHFGGMQVPALTQRCP